MINVKFGKIVYEIGIDGGVPYKMAFCPFCGYRTKEYDRNWGEPFCPRCGSQISWWASTRRKKDDN